MHHIVKNKDENIQKLKVQIGEALQTIKEQKYSLNKLDGELSYYENVNEQHKSA
jgi:uncharacterized protein (DUF3084 family)